MPPENPGKYKLDEDRLQLPKSAMPLWLQKPTDEGELFCVPIRWRRPAALLARHELEAWCLWGANAGGDWDISPPEVMKLADRDATSFALRTMMYAARYDAKGRLSCAGMFSMMVKSSGSREFWVAQEANSISIWTDAAFQWSYSKLKPY